LPGWISVDLKWALWWDYFADDMFSTNERHTADDIIAARSIEMEARGLVPFGEAADV